MSMNLSNKNPVMNKDVLVKFAIKFSLGADILKLGNRQFEKELGSENMSGSSVEFCVADGGAIQENDLNLRTQLAANGNNVRRTKKKAVTLESITAYFNMGQEDLDLLIDSSEFGSKCTAKALEKVQSKAYKTLKVVASAEKADNDAGIVEAFMNAQAYLEASKMDGELCGMANVWNDLKISTAYAKVGISTGGSLFEASKAKGLDAGTGFMGFKWSKATAGQNVKITAPYFNSTGASGGTDATCKYLYGKVTADGAVEINAVGLVNSHFSANEVVEAPFSIAGLNLVDELGEDTGVAITLTGKADATTTTKIHLDRPLRIAMGAVNNSGTQTSAVIDPLANACVNWASGEISYSAGDVTVTYGTAKAVTPVLTAGSTYYQPVLLWKKDEFLVAVKGLKSMKGTDSATIPSQFGGDKGIIPWRGTAWSDEASSSHWSRFDAYFGFGYLKGIAVRAIYIKA